MALMSQSPANTNTKWIRMSHTCSSRADLPQFVHLSDAELVEAFVMSQDCNLVRHSSTDAESIIDL